MNKDPMRNSPLNGFDLPPSNFRVPLDILRAGRAYKDKRDLRSAKKEWKKTNTSYKYKTVRKDSI